MPALTPEQQALKQAAEKAKSAQSVWDISYRRLQWECTPEVILALLAQIESMHDCPKQTPYGEAICGACMEASERDKAS